MLNGSRPVRFHGRQRLGRHLGCGPQPGWTVPMMRRARAKTARDRLFLADASVRIPLDAPGPPRKRDSDHERRHGHYPTYAVQKVQKFRPERRDRPNRASSRRSRYEDICETTKASNAVSNDAALEALNAPCGNEKGNVLIAIRADCPKMDSTRRAGAGSDARSPSPQPWKGPFLQGSMDDLVPSERFSFTRQIGRQRCRPRCACARAWKE